jgi:hypothetical protein
VPALATVRFVPVELLTDEQAEAYGTFTEVPTRPELERFFFLDDDDGQTQRSSEPAAQPRRRYAPGRSRQQDARFPAPASALVRDEPLVEAVKACGLTCPTGPPVVKRSFDDRRAARPMNPDDPGVHGGANPIGSDGD